MRAKLIDGALVYAPRKIQTEIDGEMYTVYNPPDELLAEQGWLPVVETPMPDDAPDGYHYEPTYAEWQTETGREILQEWELVETEYSIADAAEILFGGDEP